MGVLLRLPLPRSYRKKNGLLECSDDRLEPVLELILAVIKRAICDLESDASTEVFSAVRWLRSSSNSSFSFQWCCTQLDIHQLDLLNRLRREYPHLPL